MKGPFGLASDSNDLDWVDTSKVLDVTFRPNAQVKDVIANVSKRLNTTADNLRAWGCFVRENMTLRPEFTVCDLEGQLIHEFEFDYSETDNSDNPLKIYVEDIRERMTIPGSVKSQVNHSADDKTSALLFIRYFDGATVIYVGHVYVKMTCVLEDLAAIVRAHVGIHEDEKLRCVELVRPELVLDCDLSKKISELELQQGDIICFEKLNPPQSCIFKSYKDFFCKRVIVDLFRKGFESLPAQRLTMCSDMTVNEIQRFIVDRDLNMTGYVDPRVLLLAIRINDSRVEDIPTPKCHRSWQFDSSYDHAVSPLRRAASSTTSISNYSAPSTTWISSTTESSSTTATFNSRNTFKTTTILNTTNGSCMRVPSAEYRPLTRTSSRSLSLLSFKNYSAVRLLFDFSDKMQSTEIQNDLGERLLSDIKYTDVEFIVGEEKRIVKAHRVILCLGCDTFSRMLDSGMKESSEMRIELPKCNIRAFHLLKQFLYTGNANIVDENVALEVLHLAEEYMLPHLKWACEIALKRQTEVCNVLRFYASSKLYNAGDLQDYCYRFILKNFADISQEPMFKAFAKEHPTLMVKMTSLACSVFNGGLHGRPVAKRRRLK